MLTPTFLRHPPVPTMGLLPQLLPSFEVSLPSLFPPVIGSDGTARAVMTSRMWQRRPYLSARLQSVVACLGRASCTEAAGGRARTEPR